MGRYTSFLSVLALCGTLAVCAHRAAAAEPAKQLSAEQVRSLIAKLGDADYKTREAAQKDLAQAGPAALDALEQATKSDDAEVRDRAAVAIKQIKNAVALAVSLEMAKNYLWSCPIQNGVIGSPVVHAGTAYVVGQDWKLHAVDVKDGNEVWAFDMPVKGTSQISAGEKVVSLTVGMSLTVIDARKGGKLWQKDFAPVLAGPGGVGAGPVNARPGAIMIAGPTGAVSPQAWVVGDVVVARTGPDKLKAFKAASGEDAWDMDIKSAAIFCNTIVAGGVAYLTEEQSVTAIDLATQKRIWSKELANCTSLTLGGQTLACAAGGKIVALDTKKGDLLWTADMPGGGNAAGPNMLPSGVRGGGMAVADDSRLYMVVGGDVVSFDLKKGDKATAKLDLSVPQPEEGKDGGTDPIVGPRPMPAVAVAGGGFGMVTSVYYTGAARLTAADGTLYVGNNGGLFAFDGKSGQRLWMLPMKQALSADPVVSGGVIYFATTRSVPAAPGDTTPAKDLPGLHAVKLKVGAPTTAPAKAADAKPADGKP